MDDHRKLGPLFRAIGEAEELHLARAEGTARRYLEDGRIHGIFKVAGYTGHTRATRLVESHAKGTSRTPGNAYQHPTIQAYMGHWRYVRHA